MGERNCLQGTAFERKKKMNRRFQNRGRRSAQEKLQRND